MPWLIRKLLNEHDIESLELSLTQGFWHSNIWGTNNYIGASSGTFLLVKFGSNHNERFFNLFLLNNILTINLKHF